jgi:hypothetical protein
MPIIKVDMRANLELRCPDIAILIIYRLASCGCDCLWTPGVSEYCNIIIDLRVAGATVYGHPRCPNIAISIIFLTCELRAGLFMDT